MSDCSKYAEKINAYIDGALPAAEIAELLAHMETCRDCATRFESLKIIAFELRHMQEAIPSDLHSSIMAQIKEAKRPPKRAYIRIFATVAAAAAMTVFLVRGDMFDLNKIYLFGDTTVKPREEITSDADPGDAAPYIVPSAPEKVAPQTPTPRAIPPEPPVADTPSVAAAAPPEPPEPNEQATPDVPAPNLAAVPKNDLTPGVELEPKQYVPPEHIELDPAQPYRVPKLITDETFGFYCVAVGDGGVPEEFPKASVVGDIKKEPVYVYVENTSASHKDAEAALVKAGFVIMRAPTNLPKTDESAEFGLVILISK